MTAAWIKTKPVTTDVNATVSQYISTGTKSREQSKVRETLVTIIFGSGWSNKRVTTFFSKPITECSQAKLRSFWITLYNWIVNDLIVWNGLQTCQLTTCARHKSSSSCTRHKSSSLCTSWFWSRRLVSNLFLVLATSFLFMLSTSLSVDTFQRKVNVAHVSRKRVVYTFSWALKMKLLPRCNSPARIDIN